MNNLPISSKYVSTPAVPVDARERDDVVDRINAAYEAGDLDDLDYRRCLDAAFSAKTLGELRPVVELLPAQQTYATPSNITPATIAPGEVTQANAPNPRLILLFAGVVALAIVLLVAILAIF